MWSGSGQILPSSGSSNPDLMRIYLRGALDAPRQPEEKDREHEPSSEEIGITLS
jgi:hypothetical protein